ncbi:MAG: PAS domain S-box protein, partial [Maribacter sp.]
MAEIVNEKELLKCIFESAIEGILVVDDDGLLLKVNPTLEHMFGYKSGELFNTKLENLIPEKFRNQHIVHRNKYAKKPKSRPMGQNMELWGLKKNGSKIPVKISLSPTKIKGKSITIAFVTNATEINLAEQELKSYEARAKALLEAIPDMMVIQNYAGDITDFYAPKQLELQIPREEIIGKNIKEVVPPEMSKSILKTHDKAIKTNKIQIREYSLINENEKVDYEARTVRLNNHSLLTIVRDITENKRTEQELKDSLAKNRAIINALPDTIIIHDKNGNYLDIQASALSSLLFDKEMVIGKNVKDIFPIELSTKIINVLSKAHDTKSLQVLETPIPGKDRIIDCEGRVVPFEDNKLLVVLRDITQTKAVQNVLYVRNRALEVAGNGIIIVDAQQPDLPIIYSNAAFTQITGYGGSEVLGKNCRFLQKNDRNQRELGIIRKAIKEGRPCNAVLRNYQKDGTMFWNDLTITPLYNDQGLLTHFIGVQSDVTQRKKASYLKDQIRQVLEMIAQQKSLEAIGNTIVETVEGHMKECFATILLLNQEKGTLHTLSSPSLPKSFTQSFEGIEIGPTAGSCGTSAYMKKEITTTNIGKDPLWKNYKDVAAKHKINSCWSFPILSSDQDVLGTFAIYSQHSYKPNQSEREMMDDITYLARVAIEQHNTKIILQENREQLATYAQELEEQVGERTNELRATVKKLVETNLNLEDQIQDTLIAENRAMASQLMFATIAKNFPKGAIAVLDNNFRILFLDGQEVEELGVKGKELENLNIDQIDLLTTPQKSAIKESVLRTL